MSYSLGEFVQCETIQKLIDTEFEICPAMESMPAMEAILQTQKANGISQSVSDGTGKVKTVKVVYDQRFLESSVVAGNGARTCVSNTATKNNFQTYGIDPDAYLRAEDGFTIAELSTVCTEDAQSLLSKKIYKIMDVLERAVATRTASELVSLYGKWGSNVSTVGTVNGSDEFEVATLISAANKNINYQAEPKIDLALQLSGYCSTPIFVGGSTLYEYGRALDAGCCSMTGVNILDMANQFGHVYLFDKRVTTALGSADKSIVMQSGSVALIYYNEAGQIPNIGANYAKMKMYAPRTGLPMDIVIKDDCGTISIVGYVNTKLVGLPQDLYQVGDEYRGVTYVNKIKVVNPA